MSNTDFEDQEDPDFDDTPSRQVSNLSQDDVNGQVSSYLNNAPRQVVAQSDANPDDAARSIDLSSATGVPATAINGDLDGFEAKHKAFLAAQLVRGNPQLTAYVNSHPLAASVSNDDYANLDQFSSGASGLAAWLHEARVAAGRPLEPIRQGITGAAGGAVEAFNEGAGSNAPIHNPLDFLVRSASGLMNVPFGLASGGASGAAAGFGASPQAQEQAGRTAQGLVESEFGRGEIAPEIEQGTAAGLRFKSAAEAARPWTSEGLEPPTGLHPAIDELKAQSNAQALQQLDQSLADAQTSLTKERSPELFQQFVSQHFGDATIGIHGDAVNALYGDEVPSPGDGKLGFVPNLAEQLDLARATGADVHIPVSDWIGKVDPTLAKGLHDDIRMWPGGITAREAAEPIPPKVTVDSPLAQVRASGDLEPMYAMGDRKVALQKVNELPVMPGSKLAYHNFDMLDENGQKVGELELVPDPATKTLHVQMINGVGGMYANSFGPSLVRDLKRQLKSEYPDYTTITGHRVTGARFANTEQLPIGDRELEFPKVALDRPETIESLNDFHAITDAAWQKTGPGIAAQVKPSSLYNTNEKGIVRGVNAVLDRMIGNRAERIPSSKIYAQSIQDYPLGAFVQHKDRAPQLLYNLLDPDAVGVARHEGIHFLYREGFFKPEEWRTLTDAAENEGWLSRYGIGDRYGNLDYHQQVEEAIAEGYREWAGAKDEARADSPVGRIFQKLQELWEGLKRRLTALTGQELGWKDLFEATDTGEIAQREAQAAPITQGAFDSRQAFALDNDRFDALRASGAGLDIDSYRKLQAQIAKRYEEDITKAQARAEKEQAREQGKAWKDNQADVRKEVTNTIRQRPDVAADLFIGSGELYGQKLRQRYTLRADDLSPGQRSSLPDHYVSRNGLPVDEVARMFGYQSGDQMVEGLANYQSQKGDLSPQEALRQTIKQETDRQMQARYGSLDENVMDAAKDQALSETNLNILAEETYAAGLKAGTPINVDAVKSWAKESFGKMELRNVNGDRLIAQMAGHGRNAERALIGGDPAGALQSMQKKLMSAVLASEARKLEKEQKAFDKVAKQFSKRSLPSVDQDYTNYIHQILMSIGKPVRRSIHDLAENIGAGYSKTLEEFVNEKQGQLRELPVAPWLADPSFRKDYGSLSVEEFRAVRDSVKALAFNGRDELKILRAGEAQDFAATKGQMIDALKTFGDDKYKGQGKGILKAIRTYVASHIQMETLLNRWDRADPHGVWNQTIMQDLASSANQEEAWRKEYAQQLTAAGDKADLKRTVSNPIFRDPNGGLLELNRGNLRTIMLNMGTASNIDKLVRGYDINTNQLWAWVHLHAQKEDWEFAQKIWDMFDDIKGKSDIMYRNLTGGVSAESIPAQSIDSPHGKFAGGYYPVIYHADFEGKSKALMGRDPLEQENYVRATTPAGYTKGRTGYAAPMSLELDQLPGRVASMLHDVAMRPAVLNAAKVFYDHDVRKEVAARYGSEYRDLMVPYLRDVANSANYVSRAQSQFSQWSEFIRQNMVSTLVGLNPGTVLKHGPTAWVQSMQEVGTMRFLKAAKGMFSVDESTGETNWQFAMQNSQELQRRHRNYEETLSGATQKLVPSSKFDSLRSTVLKYASQPVALSDLISAVPTWSASYEKAIEEGSSHGDAIALADRSVRRAHGSTALTNRPGVMRDTNPWLTSVYSFFNHIMNRQAEMVWNAGDAIGAVKDGEYAKAMAKIPAISSQMFAYVIAPAIIEQLVTPQNSKSGDSWEEKAAKGLAFTLGASWVGVRDFTSFLTSGYDPSVGIASSAYNTAANFARDMEKNQPFGRQHAGKLIQDASALTGLATGLVPEQVGRTARFGYGVAEGTEHPRGPWQWLVGARYGTLRGHR